MKISLLLSILVFVFSCKKINTNPKELIWEIRKEDINISASKIVIEINLLKKVEENTLFEIAMQLRKDRQEFDKLWIFYYTPNNYDGDAWATTHFTPNLKINIIGSTEDEDKKTSNTNNLNGEVIGKWRSENSLMGSTLILYKNEGEQLIMRINFDEKSNLESEIIETNLNGIKRYDDNNNHGEYYILESNGNLGMYGENGKFDEAIKLSN